MFLKYNVSLLPIFSCGWQGPVAEVLAFKKHFETCIIIMSLLNYSNYIGKDTGKTMR